MILHIESPDFKYRYYKKPNTNLDDTHLVFVLTGLCCISKTLTFLFPEEFEGTETGLTHLEKRRIFFRPKVEEKSSTESNLTFYC